jgi:ABC-2 type transport system permease protein/lipopolysaccharide transport system permease protein
MNGTFQVARAWNDFVRSLRMWQAWTYIGLQDIKLRYRRSVLGPLWITLSMGTTIVGVGILYSSIFRTDVGSYLPFLAVGLIVWSYLNGLIADGCMTFINEGAYIRQMPAPLLAYQFKATWRAVIIFAHNFLIFFAVALYFQIWPGWGYLEALLGFALVTINGTWIAVFLSILCSRYRDVPQIVQSVLGIMFFLTPILWNPNAIPGRPAFVELNPLHHLIEVIRAPLLGSPTDPLSWIIVTGMAILGSGFTFLLFSRYRRRIAYWV